MSKCCDHLRCVSQGQVPEAISVKQHPLVGTPSCAAVTVRLLHRLFVLGADHQRRAPLFGVLVCNIFVTPDLAQFDVSGRAVCV